MDRKGGRHELAFARLQATVSGEASTLAFCSWLCSDRARYSGWVLLEGGELDDDAWAWGEWGKKRIAGGQNAASFDEAKQGMTRTCTIGNNDLGPDLRTPKEERKDRCRVTWYNSTRRAPQASSRFPCQPYL